MFICVSSDVRVGALGFGIGIWDGRLCMLLGPIGMLPPACAHLERFGYLCVRAKNVLSEVDSPDYQFGDNGVTSLNSMEPTRVGI